jgi:hypothetical protein
MEVSFVNSKANKEQPLWMEMPLVSLQANEVQPLWIEVPQVATFSNVVDSLKVVSLTTHTCSELKSLDYGAISIEFVNCLPIKFNGDILFKLPLVCHQFRQSRQLQGMDRKFYGHAWCKLPLQQKVSMYAKWFH